MSGVNCFLYISHEKTMAMSAANRATKTVAFHYSTTQITARFVLLNGGRRRKD